MVKNALSIQNIIYIVFNSISLLSILFLTDIVAICGVEKEPIMVYQIVSYVPQAIVMLIAPFFCYVTYIESIPKKWKIVKYIIIGILFTVSMVTTLEFGIPMLAAEYGSAETKLLIFPIMFYMSLALAILKELNVTLYEEETM